MSGAVGAAVWVCRRRRSRQYSWRSPTRCSRGSAGIESMAGFAGARRGMRGLCVRWSCIVAAGGLRQCIVGT